ncbi:hypothetical protein MRX96_042081 [Rhipicephalus microplus]
MSMLPCPRAAIPRTLKEPRPLVRSAVLPQGLPLLCVISSWTRPGHASDQAPEMQAPQLLMRQHLATTSHVAEFDKVIWRKRRKALTPAFHFRILDEYVPIMNRRAVMLTDKLAHLGKEHFDILPIIRLAAFAILFAFDQRLKDELSHLDVVRTFRYVDDYLMPGKVPCERVQGVVKSVLEVFNRHSSGLKITHEMPVENEIQFLDL